MKGPQITKYIKALFASVKLTREQLADGNANLTGSLIEYDGATLSQGDVVYLIDQGGNCSLLEDGSYQRKKGGSFIITDGTVSSVSNPTEAPSSKEPIPQAQSKQEPEMEIKQEAETPLEQPKETAVELAADPAIPAVPTVDVSDYIDQKLAPLFLQMDELKQIIASQILMSTETKTALSKVAEDVKLMADQPAGKPIEKEINTFSGPAKEVKDNPLSKYFS